MRETLCVRVPDSEEWHAVKTFREGANVVETLCGEPLPIDEDHHLLVSTRYSTARMHSGCASVIAGREVESPSTCPTSKTRSKRHNP
jgi:hypothetical protein